MLTFKLAVVVAAAAEEDETFDSIILSDDWSIVVECAENAAILGLCFGLPDDSGALVSDFLVELFSNV
jgi:hypothetical protein